MLNSQGRRALLKGLASLPASQLPLPAQPSQPSPAANWQLQLPSEGTRPWISGETWANPLQDWLLSSGQIVCNVPGGDRTVSLLTRSLSNAMLPFELSVVIRSSAPLPAEATGYVGFHVGLQGRFQDYRDSALRGTGLAVGVTADGRLFLGDLLPDAPRLPNLHGETKLTLQGEPDGPATFLLTLSAQATDTAAPVRLQRPATPADWLHGLVALACSSGPDRRPNGPNPAASALPPLPQRQPHFDSGFANRPNSERGGHLRFSFSNLTGGTPAHAGPRTKWLHHPERTFGPIFFTQYTVHRRTLKLTAQLAPTFLDLPPAKATLVCGGRPVAEADVDPGSWTARFRVDHWEDRRPQTYEVHYEAARYRGTITANPTNQPAVTIGALTCQLDYGFPHADIFRQLQNQRPDILLFTGDQIYERNGDFGIQRAPFGQAALDFLRKWLLFGWAWGDLTRHLPTITLPDDHDVYHGNLWGAGGKLAIGEGKTGQDSGGYLMPANWVNLVQRCQSSHLPDPPDPAPVHQNLSVHFCHWQWGGLSLAILEDRKWKSAPAAFLPDARIDNGFPQNPDFDAKTSDRPSAQLLGPRQEAFLARWIEDWSLDTFQKLAVSATIFCNLATLPKPALTDSVTSRLPVLKPDEYSEDEKMVTDYDSNAWPQSKRNLAVDLLAQACAFHVAGDQHLASTVQYGLPEEDRTHHNGPFALCTPAISNVFPRRWYPPAPGPNPTPSQPRNTGDYFDGFGNPITVHAVANPAQFGQFPASLHNRAPGFGLVVCRRADRTITFTNFQRWNGQPYPGWPITFSQTDNRYRQSRWRIPIPRRLLGKTTLVSVHHAVENRRLYLLRLGPKMKSLPVPQSGSYFLQPEQGPAISVEAVPEP